MPKSHDQDVNLTLELLALLKKTMKGIIEFFEQQLSRIKISDELTLLNLLKFLGRLLSHILLIYKFYRLYKKAIKLGKRLGKGCDLIYVPELHPKAAHFRNGGIEALPIKVPGNQAYILVGHQWFFVDRYEATCVKWHVVDNERQALLAQHAQAWFHKERSRKEQAHLQEAMQEGIPHIRLSAKRLAIIQSLAGHRRPKERIKGKLKSLFAVIEILKLLLIFFNNLLKLNLIISSMMIVNASIAQAIIQTASLMFFAVAFLFIILNIVKTLSSYFNEKDLQTRNQLRQKLLWQLVELSLPFAVITVAGLIVLGMTAPMLSVCVTMGCLSFPFFQNIFRSVDAFLAFQASDPGSIKKTIRKFLKFLANSISLVISGYLLAKDLMGTSFYLGEYLVDLGQLAMNSSGFIFTVFVIICALVEIVRNSIVLVQALINLTKHNSLSFQATCYSDALVSVVNIVFSSALVSLALLGFWGIMNPLLAVILMGSFFLMSLIVNKFVPDWASSIIKRLYMNNTNVGTQKTMEVLGMKETQVSMDLTHPLNLSSHSSAFFASKLAKAPVSPRGSEKNLEEVPEILVNSFDVNSDFL